MIKFLEIRFYLLILTFIYVESMSIKGPVLTRYDPCGIGTVYFDKVTDNLWRADILLGLYQQIVSPVIEVSFKQKMIVYGSVVNSAVVASNDWHDFTITPEGVLPARYYFYVAINDFHPLSTPAITRFTFNNVTLCDESLKLSQTVASLNLTKQNDRISQHVCGRRTLHHVELTTLRTDAQPGDWPWHVAISIQQPGSAPKYQCGGNIISLTAVLTAGHCLYDNDVLIPTNQLIIEAGVTNLKDPNQIGRQRFIAERAILHPAYNNRYATADLAIIIVRHFVFTEYVQPICIWGPVYNKTSLFGQEGAIVGFGTTENNVLSNTLRATNIMVQNDSTCLAYSLNLYQTLLNEFTFCAGFGPDSGINPRNGDSGGGLIIPTIQTDYKVSWFLRGILSKCGVSLPKVECDPQYYVVYTDVGPHYGWIYQNGGLVYKSNIEH